MHFTPHTSYAIVGYDGAATHAAGQGTAHIMHPTAGHIEHMFFVYVPSIEGTIVSLEHHARTHPYIHRWIKEATPASNSGWVIFYDQHDQEVSRYKTVQEQELYYIQDLKFLPAPIKQHIAQVSTIRQESTSDDNTTVKTATIPILNCVDFDHTLQTDNKAMQ